MRIITPIRLIPPELRGLWKLQYAPIERIFQMVVDSPDINEIGINNAKNYKKASLAAKLSVLDRLHANAVRDSIL